MCSVMVIIMLSAIRYIEIFPLKKQPKITKNNTLIYIIAIGILMDGII